VTASQARSKAAASGERDAAGPLERLDLEARERQQHRLCLLVRKDRHCRLRQRGEDLVRHACQAPGQDPRFGEEVGSQVKSEE
jgi:hypothetical protein